MNNVEKNRLIIETFTQVMQSKGFKEAPPVAITSKVDLSTYFIGASISLFKSNILNSDFPKEPVFIVQNCLRTHLLYAVKKKDELPRWSSFFTSLSLFGKCNHLPMMFEALNEWLLNHLKLPHANLQILVNKEDTDLLELVRTNTFGVSYKCDVGSLTAYRHQFGMPGVRGRNFNYSILHGQTGFAEVGNIIKISASNAEKCAEAAFGASTLLSAINGRYYSIESDIIADYLPVQTKEDILIADCVTSSMALLQEGLIPSSRSQGRLLREYLRLLKIHILFNKINEKSFRESIEAYGELMYRSKHASSILNSFVFKI